MLEVSVLGPVEVRRDGALLPVPGGRTAELLVRLALDAGTFVRADRLVEDLWAEVAVQTRRNTLQSKVAKLRRALGDPALVERSEDGYRLVADGITVDASVVLAEAAAVADLVRAGQDHAAADLGAAALGRYRGDVLAGAGSGEWATPHRTRLEEARTNLLEAWFAARLRIGDDLVGELEATVAAHPFQEGLWELLITALYRAGRQADALATYQRVRARLAEELGLDPGPGLQRIEQQVLAHDPHLLGAAPGAARPLSATGNLPSLVTELVGRHAELATLAGLLAEARLVELVGPGGVGKTALAVATAHRSDALGGAWLVRLETATTASDVIDAVIAALDVTGGEAALLERLRGTEALIVLDNCEHVVDAAAGLVTRVLDAGPGVRVLCTSQVPLGLDGEVLLELDPLGIEDAVDLFTRRASVQPGSSGRPRDDAAVEDLCRSLDGLPLAIELAAARTRSLSIEEITRRLDEPFTVLADPTSRRPERRRALKATIRWSYELLFTDDRRGLWALATFAGGAPLDAVESVLEALDVPRPAAIDVIGRLVSRSLVIVDDEGGATAPRYRLLDSIRAFAREAMTEAGLADRAHAAHAAWFESAARSSTAGVRSSAQAAHLAFARAERANVDAALAWCGQHDPASALAIAEGFGWAWVVLGDSRGAQRLAAAIDASAEVAAVGDRSIALLLEAWIEASTGDLEPALAHITEAEALAETTADDVLLARCCCYRAYVVSHRGEFALATELCARADRLAAALDRPWDQCATWLFAARAAISAGDVAGAQAARAQVEHWLDAVDDPWMHVRYEAMLGELARLEHRFDDAVRHIGQAAETSHRLGFLQTEAYQVASLGRAQCQAGDPSAGAVTLERAIEKAETTGDVRMAALARVHLGRVLRGLGDDRRARVTLEATVAWHRAAGGGEQAALGECLLAAMDAADHEAGAADRLTAILADARRDGLAHVEVFALDALARAAAVAGDASTARRLVAEADARMADTAHFVSELDRVDATVTRGLLEPAAGGGR